MNKFLSYFLIAGIFLSSSGCTMFRHDLTKTQNKINASVVENNSAAYIASLETKARLQAAKTQLETAKVPTNGEPAQLEQKNYFSADHSINGGIEANDLTLDFTRRNQNMLGLPPIDQTTIIQNLLSTNQNVRESAQDKQISKANAEQGLKQDETKYEQSLLAFGQKYEEERNARIKFWTKWGTIVALVLGGGICLMVFFPPAIGFIVGIFPKLIGVFGVVGKGVVKDVVSGVGNARAVLQTQIDTAKAHPNVPEPTYTATQALALLDKHLSDATSDKSQTVIDHLRDVQNV